MRMHNLIDTGYYDKLVVDLSLLNYMNSLAEMFMD